MVSTDRKQNIGSLVEGLEVLDNRFQQDAACRLCYLLPTLTSADRELLTEHQRAILLRYMAPAKAERNLLLTHAILQAWRQVGGEKELIAVETLAHCRVLTLQRWQVRAVARALLEPIETRLAEERAQQAALVEADALGETEEKKSNANNVPERGEEEMVFVTTDTEVKGATRNVDHLLQELEEERQTHRQPGMRIGFLIASWLVIVPYCLIQVVANRTNLPLALMWSFLSVAVTQLHRVSLSSRQTMVARRLASSDNVAGVGPLAEALEWPDQEVREVAAEALTRLLPRLNASDANLLNAKQRGCLYRCLRIGSADYKENFVIAILKALEQVGDAQALPYVARLAETDPNTLNTRQKRVRLAAMECLPLLQIRANDHTASTTLLRASSLHEIGNAGEVLLRPATHGSEVPAEQLLRSSAEEPASTTLLQNKTQS